MLYIYNIRIRLKRIWTFIVIIQYRKRNSSTIIQTFVYILEKRSRDIRKTVSVLGNCTYSFILILHFGIWNYIVTQSLQWVRHYDYNYVCRFNFADMKNYLKPWCHINCFWKIRLLKLSCILWKSEAEISAKRSLFIKTSRPSVT